MSTIVGNTSVAVQRLQTLLHGVGKAFELLADRNPLAEVLPEVVATMGAAADYEGMAIVEYRRGVHISAANLAIRASWISPRRDPSLPWPFDSEAAFGKTQTFPIQTAGRPWGVLVLKNWSDADERTAAELDVFRSLASALGMFILRAGAREEQLEGKLVLDGLLAGLSETVFQIDLEGRWSFLNPAWKGMTGYETEATLGRRFAESIDPKDATTALEEFGLLVSGKSLRTSREIRFRHRDGKSVLCRVTAHRQKNTKGQLVGVAGTLVDLTAKHLAQQAARDSEQRFSVVFSSASDALFLFDEASGVIVECNASAARMFESVDAAELIGMRIEQLQKRCWNESENAAVRDKLAGGGVWRQEVELRTLRSREFWGQMAIVGLGERGKGTRLLQISDISELKRAEEQLRRSLADKEVLLKEVYHRVKNNLQIISALLRLQARQVTDDGALDAIEKSINRVMAMSMVHEKLYQAQNLSSIDFLSFAEGLVGFLNQLTESESSKAVVNVSGSPLMLSMDRAIPLGLILNELVTNSIKYAYAEGECGTIDVEVAGGGGTPAMIVVEDRGRGMAEAELAGTSSSLGFRIVRMLVEQLHGELDLESDGGLRVCVTVPMHCE